MLWLLATLCFAGGFIAVKLLPLTSVTTIDSAIPVIGRPMQWMKETLRHRTDTALSPPVFLYGVCVSPSTLAPERACPRRVRLRAGMSSPSASEVSLRTIDARQVRHLCDLAYAGVYSGIERSCFRGPTPSTCGRSVRKPKWWRGRHASRRAPRRPPCFLFLRRYFSGQHWRPPRFPCALAKSRRRPVAQGEVAASSPLATETPA